MKNSFYGLLSGAALAQSISLNQADIPYIYDADTFFVQCPECENGKRGVRVMGLDSLEIRGRCRAETVLARRAKQFAVEKIRLAKAREVTRKSGTLLKFVCTDCCRL